MDGLLGGLKGNFDIFFLNVSFDLYNYAWVIVCPVISYISLVLVLQILK